MLLSAVSASAIDFTGLFDDGESGTGTVQETTMDDYLDIPVASLKDDGMIRVYLKSLNLPLSVAVTLNGGYSIGRDDMQRFDRETRIILSDGGDAIYMTIGGFTMNMGQKVELLRRAAGASAQIEETKRLNLFPADISVTREEAGGGLRVVLTMAVEDYLPGVVGYEMSDSWPIEALKSQAVAARTYALRCKSTSANRDYDLVDTTADQVYHGTDPSLLNVAAAVKATCGTVGMYKGKYAACYYTASNGGETALPSDIWGSDADNGYLDRREDPYDLENPNSIIKTLSISGECDESPELKAMIEEGLLEQIRAAGLPEGEYCLDTILSMEPVDPVPADSKMYRKLRITAAAAEITREYVPAENDIGAPAPATGIPAADMALSGIDMIRRVLNESGYEAEEVLQEVEGTYQIDLDVYEQIKPLGLAINSSDCELITVESGQFGFTISMMRFGHGVGMSQRGAQRMAGSHGMSWRDILSFYYPGMELQRIEWNISEPEPLPQLSANVGNTFTAPSVQAEPAPLPELADGERYAAVKLDDTSSTLNMRVMPTTESRIIALLASGQRLIVSGEPDDNGWVSVHTAEFSGYVKNEYLEYE